MPQALSGNCSNHSLVIQIQNAEMADHGPIGNKVDTELAQVRQVNITETNLNVDVEVTAQKGDAN